MIEKRLLTIIRTILLEEFQKQEQNQLNLRRRNFEITKYEIHDFRVILEPAQNLQKGSSNKN